MLAGAVCQPSEVFAASGCERQGDEFGGVVGVQLTNDALQFGNMFLPCLENDEYLITAFEFSFPPVMRLDGGDDVGAGDELGLERGLGHAPGKVDVGRRHEDHRKVFRSNHVPN